MKNWQTLHIVIQTRKPLLEVNWNRIEAQEAGGAGTPEPILEKVEEPHDQCLKQRAENGEANPISNSELGNLK